jgi:hypothetical protein
MMRYADRRAAGIVANAEAIKAMLESEGRRRVRVEGPARPGTGVEAVGQAKLETLDAGPGDHRPIVGAEAGRRCDQVEAGAFGCSRCPLLPVCGGACPKEWIEGRAPCPSSKRNIAQRLLLAAAFERMDRAAGDPSLPAVA